jgi:hypothetical protein
LNLRFFFRSLCKAAAKSDYMLYQIGRSIHVTA